MNRLAQWLRAWGLEAWVPILILHFLAMENAGKGVQGKCLEKLVMMSTAATTWKKTW